jgi:hypothetical protein
MDAPRERNSRKPDTVAAKTRYLSTMTIQREPVQGAQVASELSPSNSGGAEMRPLRKFAASVPPGRSEYRISHNLQTEDVIVQTRIAGRIREGGISIIDANTVQLIFGGVLNEAMDVVIIG